jgi:DNA-binding CsgD family transcriptional regulator
MFETSAAQGTHQQGGGPLVIVVRLRPTMLIFRSGSTPGVALGGSVEAERAAVLRAIEAETAAFLAKDYDAWAECWLHSEHVRRWSWYPTGGLTIEAGWERLSALMKQAMQDFPQPLSVEIRRENLSLRIAGEMAWATYDQYSGNAPDPFSLAGLQHELKILEKVRGEWKLSCVSVLKPYQQLVDCPVLQVDKLARVLWMNERARTGIKRHPVLTISAGTLRARDRRSDADLRAAIAWAASLQDAMHQQAARSRLAPTGGALPVILGEGDDHAPCWVRVEGGHILVSFDDEVALANRLSTAAAIFGLSPAQVRLSRHIADGHDLSHAAAELGISVNTARTQLKRIFDKTGVHSQPALVRVLLSAGTPVG